MIQITQKLSLQPIKDVDSIGLYNLMNIIYPKAYSHFWKDNGRWYVDKQYSKENIEKELLEEKSDYYFVVFNNERIGNFRVLWNYNLLGLENKKSVKLHRIYLHSKSHGNGIGKTLVTWLENLAYQKGYELIWLDAMDEQPQAYQFYCKLGYQYFSHEFLNFDLLYDKVRKMSQLYKELKKKDI